MDIWRLLTAIIRRWYIIIPLLVATAVAAVTVGRWVAPEYTTSAIINITPSRATVQLTADKATVANPYSVPTYSTGILQYVLSSSAVRQELLAAGLAGSYVVEAVPRSSFLGINATADDPELAIATARGVIESARRILAERQGAIETPTPRLMSIEVLDDADSVSASVSGQSQALAAVLAVGGIVSVIATVLIDDLLLLRRRRHDREANVKETLSRKGAVSAEVSTAVRPSHGARG